MMCRKGGLRAAAQGCVGTVSFLLCVIAGLSAPIPASASVQLVSFSVTSPPPPESHPTSTTSASPSHLGASATTVTLPAANDPTVGTMAGTASTDGGAALYTIPIVVPPGRAGMQPSLALTYSSRGGNGPLGVGWAISGTSSIHRCAQTPEQDGQAQGVAYSANDKLCLDGQRLVSVAGTYGTAGAEYRTEVDSYTRIFQVAGGLTSNDNTACFRVEHRDGRIVHYGGVVVNLSSCTITSGNNTRVLPNNTTPLSWLVEKIEDRVGNNQLYAYANYGNGEVLPYTITYTGFGATAGDRVVTFNFQARTSAASGVYDMASSYLASAMTMQTKALQWIKTSVNGTTARLYTPKYLAAVQNGRLFLTSIQECAGSGCVPGQASCPTGASACHPATAFYYNDSGLDYQLTSLASITLPPQSPQVMGDSSGAAAYQANVIGDLDGDGARETVVEVDQGGVLHEYLEQLTADRVANSSVNLDGVISPRPQDYVDIDGDGRSELIRVPQSSGDPHQVVSFNVWNQPRGTAVSSNPFTTVYSDITYLYGQGGAPHGDTVLTADVNGDGRQDVIVIKPDSSCGTDAIGNRNGVFAYINAFNGSLLSLTQSAHFVQTPASGPLFCLNRTISGSGAGTLITSEYIDHITDFNGDGLPDFVLATTGSGATSITRVMFNHATNATLGTPQSLTCSQLGLTSDECNLTLNYLQRWMDVNGDGLEDFVIARPGGTWQVRLNQGGSLGGMIDTGSTAGLDTYLTPGSTNTNAFRYVTKLPVMDVDGDGKPDILVVSTTQGPNQDGFALKMCTMVKVNQIISEGKPICPSDNLIANKPITQSTSSTLAQICPAYACPENPGTGTLTTYGTVKMPSSGMVSYPFQWNAENGTLIAAFDMYKSTSSSETSRSAYPNDDNSTYHLAMLKFVQTGPAAFSVNVVETPIVSRLNQPGTASNNAEDLFGDGLADLVTQIGCANVQQQFPIQGQPNVYNTYDTCAAIGNDSSGKNWGPTTLPDGAATAGFNINPVLYANINQGANGLSQANRPAPSAAQQVPRSNALRPSVTTAALQPRPYLPGVMDAVVNGLGDTTSWGYYPLALPEADYGFPLYTVPTGATQGYVDSRHYYVQSTMPVVYGMLQTPAVGSDSYGFRSAVYGYAQGMFNHFGRGFQGFYQITSRIYEPTSSPTLQARTLQTVTTFNQKFPLVGRVASVQKSAVATGVVIEQETDTYQCATNTNSTLSGFGSCPQGDTLSPLPTSGVAFQPVMTAKSVQESDLRSGTASSHVTTSNTWDHYGNVTTQTVTHFDDTAGGVFLDTTKGHATTITSSFDYSSVGSWWLNNLTSTSVASTVNYDGSHSLPATASAPKQTVTTSYTWNNNDRTPATKTVQGTGVSNEDVASAYSYPTPSYGLPRQVQICLGDYNTSGQCIAQVGSALSPTRTTKYTYTKDGTSAAADGYFVLTTSRDPTDAFTQTQTTTITHEPYLGLALTTTDPNNVQTVASYDPFGRAIQLDYLNNATPRASYQSSVYNYYTTCIDNTQALPTGHCPSSLVGEETVSADLVFETNAAYRITTVQSGYPTEVTWYDLLGRKVKEGHVAFDGNFIASVTSFDDMGKVYSQSTPYLVATPTYTGTNPFLTTYVYDALGRPTQKTVDDSDLNQVKNPQHQLQADYIYYGRQTTMTVHDSTIALGGGNSCPANASNLCLVTVRKTNALGQLMQTTELPILGSSTSTTTTPHITNYWTDAQGQVAAISDPETNLTTAIYNALGQRTSSSDPDQGAWTFSYDGLGELISQTDPRGPSGVGVVTSVNGRDALGRVTEQEQLPPSVAQAGLDPNVFLDDWTYDPANGIGELNIVTRKRGSNRSTPANNPIVWQESYTYEPATARLSTIATSVTEASTVAMNSSMDYDSSGRPNTHTYPSGLVVTNGYTTYGQLQSLSNTRTVNGQPVTTTYWTATAENEWDHVIGETFANGLTGSHSDYDSTGQAAVLSWGTTDNFKYGYDPLGNLVSQSRTGVNGEAYYYDPLQRLTSAQRTVGAAVNYAYTTSGNLKYKDDFSTNTGTNTPAYTYANANSTTNNCGPHAANTVALPNSMTATYQCDPSGNVITGTLTYVTPGNAFSATYDPDNHPTQASRVYVGALVEPCKAAAPSDTIFCDGYEVLSHGTSGGTAAWAYDSNGQRSYEHANNTHRYYGPAGYEQTDTAKVHELGPVIVTRLGTTDNITVVLRDRLGSTLDTIDGSQVTQRAFDAFGKARNGDLSDRANGTLNLADTIHGFTSHTHEDDVALVHMNGRVFDPNLGRFLTVDPMVKPGTSQGLNPYSYIRNSPMSGTDPTGYDATTSDEAVSWNSVCARAIGSCGQVYGTDAQAGLAAASQSNSGSSQGGGPQARTQKQNDPVNAGNTTTEQPLVQGHGADAGTKDNPEKLPNIEVRAYTHSPAGDAFNAELRDQVQLALNLLNFGSDRWDREEQIHERMQARHAREAAGDHPFTSGAADTLAMVTVLGLTLDLGEAEELGQATGTVEIEVQGVRGSSELAYTSKIDRSAFKSERSQYWKAEAQNNAASYSATNVARMKKGKAPIGADGHPMELHHKGGTQNGGLQSMTRTEHRLGDKYLENHPWLRTNNGGN
jgi:RHS repeat-associated protein